MDTIKISYTVWAKHGDNLYCRVRQKGCKPLDVNLHTTDRNKAEAYVKLRQSELELYNSYILAGESVPEDVANKLLRRGSPVTQSATKSVVTTRQAMDKFELYLRRKGSREATVHSYLRQVRLTLEMDVPVTSYTRKYLHERLAIHDHCKSATRKIYSVSVREFVKFCVAEYDIDYKLLNDWPLVRVQEYTRPYWKMNEMYHIIEGVHCRDKAVEEQFKVFCWIMATAGTRQGETGALKWSDYRDGAITIRAEISKNRKSRVVPLDMRVCEMLERLPRNSSLIFDKIPPSQPGRFAILANAIRRSKMPPGGLHAFRQGVAKILYAKCTDITKVAALLGHSAQTSLKYYAEARQSEDLRQMVDQVYEQENMIPSTMDWLIKEGLI